MMRFRFTIPVLLTLLAAGAAALISLHRANAQRQARLREQRVRWEQRRPDPPIATASTAEDRGAATAPAAAATPDHARLVQLRAEVSTLEQKAAAAYAAQPEPTDAPSTHRDPERGMTKLEYLRNVGQATPAAALQTLFWAALKGQEAAMAHTITWEESVRPEVQELIDRLPAELRARYPTPESLAALAISRHALEVSAIHITATTPADDSHATLTVKGLTGADEKLPMRRGADGWQLLAGEPMLEVLRQQLGGKK